MGCHFDERAVPVRAQATGGALEQHRLAHVAVPVGGVEPAGVDASAGHRGVERDPRRLRGDPGESRHQLVAQRLDRSGVAGGVDARDPAGGRVRRQQFVHRGRVAGNRDGFRRVDRRDGEPVAPGREVDPLGGQRYGGHRALPGQGQPGPAAQGDDARGVPQRQGPGDVRGGDLALRVADHRSGLDAVRTPHRRQRHHHGEQHRLDPVDALVRTVQRVEHRPVHELGQRVGTLPRAGAEGLRAGHQLLGHARPLRTLTREDEDHRAGFRDARFRDALDEARVQAPPGERGQTGVDVLDDRGAVVEPGPRGRQGVCDVGRIRVHAGQGTGLVP